MDVQQSFFEQLRGLVTVKGSNRSWERLETVLSKGYYEDVYKTSYFLFICLLGTKFHEKLVPALFVLCLGVAVSIEHKEAQLAKQFLKSVAKIIESEEKKVVIARSFKNLVEENQFIVQVLEKNGSIYEKLFRIVLLLAPVSDNFFKEDLFEFAKVLEEKRLLQQVLDCATSVKKEKSIDFSQIGATVLVAKVKELQVVANFLRGNSPLTQESLAQSIDLYGLVSYYTKRLADAELSISTVLERIVDFFEDYPKSTVRATYIKKLQTHLGVVV